MPIQDILDLQREFQLLCEVDIDTCDADKVNELSETFLFKAIEEIIELRKTFPSVLNKWAKTQPTENKAETLDELSDVLLFLVNMCLVRKISPEEVLMALKTKQQINFQKVKEKKLAALYKEMQAATDNKIGLGGGNSSPHVIIIGQNPGASLNTLGEDANCWDNIPDNGAVAFLKRSLKGRYDEKRIYFTNIVKEATEGNAEPSRKLVEFWWPYLVKELAILKGNNVGVQVLAMGKFAQQQMMQRGERYNPITHPSYFMRNGFSETEYWNEQLKGKLP